MVCPADVGARGIRMVKGMKLEGSGDSAHRLKLPVPP